MLNFESKPVIAMLHLKGDSEADMMKRMIREAITYYANGVDAVLVENVFGSPHACELALKWLYTNMPNKCYGVNILSDYKETFRLAKEYHADFVRIDSVYGHLPPKEDMEYATKLIENEKDKTFDVLGGAQFKRQLLRNKISEADVLSAKQRCDAIVATGVNTSIEKLKEMRQLLGHFPLIVGAGVTANTITETLKYADGVIIGRALKEEHNIHGDVCEEYVKEIMKKVDQARASAILGYWSRYHEPHCYGEKVIKNNQVQFAPWWELKFKKDYCAAYSQMAETEDFDFADWKYLLEFKDYRIITVNLKAFGMDSPVCSFFLGSSMSPIYPVKGVNLYQTRGEFSLFRTENIEPQVELSDSAWQHIHELMNVTKTEFSDIAIFVFEAEKEFDMAMYHHLPGGEKKLIFEESY